MLPSLSCFLVPATENLISIHIAMDYLLARWTEFLLISQLRFVKSLRKQCLQVCQKKGLKERGNCNTEIMSPVITAAQRGFTETQRKI